MRAKVAKFLRKTAKKQTIGLPERHLIWNGPSKKFAINNPQSTRGLYRFLKKAIKQRRIHHV